MKLVIFLNNIWDWSGGMPQILAWRTGRRATLDTTTWPEYTASSAPSTRMRAAQVLYRRYIACCRANEAHYGPEYRDDRAFRAWETGQRASSGGARRVTMMQCLWRFRPWVEGTAAYIHALDPHHLRYDRSEATWAASTRREFPAGRSCRAGH